MKKTVMPAASGANTAGLRSQPTTARTGLAQWFAEGVATFGLVATILGTLRWRPDAVPYAVGLFITAGYWFTASTSFANPAVTVARAFADTFAGIRPGDAPAFVAAQAAGALAATATFAWLLRPGSAEARAGGHSGAPLGAVERP